MQFIKKGFQKTLTAIKQHKYLFITLIVLQLIFFFLFSLTALNYQVKILENAQEITTAVQFANYDPDSVQAGEPFLKDMATLYRSYQDFQKNIFNLLLWLLSFFLLINGTIWVITHYLLKPEKRISYLLQRWLKYVASTLIFLVLLVLGGYFLLKKALSSGDLTSSINLLTYLFLILYYFLLVAFAFISLLSWKQFFQTVFVCSIKKIPQTIIVLVINITLIAIITYLTYLTLVSGKYPSLTIISGLGLILTIVLSRIFWTATLPELVKK